MWLLIATWRRPLNNNRCYGYGLVGARMRQGIWLGLGLGLVLEMLSTIDRDTDMETKRYGRRQASFFSQ